MRRPLVGVALLYAGGVLLGRVWAAPLPWLLAATALALLTSLLHRCRQPKWLVLALVLAGWTNLTLHTTALAPHDLRRLAGEAAAYVTIQGRLAWSPEVRGDAGEDHGPRTLAVVDVESLRGLDPGLQSFTNANTPQEYAALVALARTADKTPAE